MRETFYILQEVQQRGLTLSLEMIGFVRKPWRIQGRGQTDAVKGRPPLSLSKGQKQVNMAIKTNY